MNKRLQKNNRLQNKNKNYQLIESTVNQIPHIAIPFLNFSQIHLPQLKFHKPPHNSFT